MEVFLVVPAWSDQAGQMRIVSKVRDTAAGALADYRRNPDGWLEAGIVNNEGKLVCLSGPDCIRTDMRDAQPIAGGYVFTTR